MAKIKKAQDGWVMKAACRRGVCGKGSVSDKRAARIDRREERKAAREDRRAERQNAREQRRWERSGLKTGGKVKKAQDGKKMLKYTTPSGVKVTTDTSGYAAGKKNFPTKLEGKAGTMYGMSGKKSTKRGVEYSQGAPYKRQNIKVGFGGSKKAKKALGSAKTGKTISKKK